MAKLIRIIVLQLPEPLMTVRLYPEFIEVAREHTTGKLTEQECVSKLKHIINSLPPANLKTAAMIIHHLKR